MVPPDQINQTNKAYFLSQYIKITVLKWRLFCPTPNCTPIFNLIRLNLYLGIDSVNAWNREYFCQCDILIPPDKINQINKPYFLAQFIKITVLKWRLFCETPNRTPIRYVSPFFYFQDELIWGIFCLPPSRLKIWP